MTVKHKEFDDPKRLEEFANTKDFKNKCNIITINHSGYTYTLWYNEQEDVTAFLSTHMYTSCFRG